MTTQTPQSPAPPYNKTFETLVALDADGERDLTTDHVSGIIAYGIYKQSKREWMARYKAQHGRSPAAAEVDAWSASQTGPTQIKVLKSQAESIIAELQNAAVVTAKPEIERDALKTAFWPAVRASMTAAALYTMALIILSFVFAFAGVDILAIFETVRTLAQ